MRKVTLTLLLALPMGARADVIQIMTGNLQPGIEGQPYEAFIHASGGDPTTRTWTATDLPPGLSIADQGGAGKITGVPTAPRIGGGPTIVVTDAAGNRGEAWFQLLVRGSDSPLHLQLVTPPQAVAGERYRFAITGGGNLSYSIFAGALPPGLRMSSAGTIVGTVDASAPARSYALVIQAIGGDHAIGYANYAIEVVEPKEKGGCSSAGGASWLGLLALAAWRRSWFRA